MNSGGFSLHIDTNGSVYQRKEIKKIFPNNDLVEIPSNHSLFQKLFPFPKQHLKFTA
jgi:hypothetical protein